MTSRPFAAVASFFQTDSSQVKMLSKVVIAALPLLASVVGAVPANWQHALTSPPGAPGSDGVIDLCGCCGLCFPFQSG